MGHPEKEEAVIPRVTVSPRLRVFFSPRPRVSVPPRHRVIFRALCVLRGLAVGILPIRIDHSSSTFA